MSERQIDSEHTEYPRRLSGVPGMPGSLWLDGPACLNPDRSVAIVGTRSPFYLSMEVAQAVARIAAIQGYTIVSGYATGIDTAAHWGAMDAEAPTIAVLGSGIRRKEPFKLALERYVQSTGIFISEVPDPDARRATKHLSDRNRITAGLADAVIVVETDTEGGATARFAQAYGRAVYAAIWSGHPDYHDPRRLGSDSLVEENVAVALHLLDEKKKYLRGDLDTEIKRVLLGHNLLGSGSE